MEHFIAEFFWLMMVKYEQKPELTDYLLSAEFAAIYYGERAPRENDWDCVKEIANTWTLEVCRKDCIREFLFEDGSVLSYVRGIDKAFLWWEKP